MTTFLSLAISDMMFTDGECRRETITPADVQAALDAGAQRALNPSHITTIDLIHRKFGLSLPVPDKAPKIALRPGDTLIVVQANLPRLAEGQVHSDETVAHASIPLQPLDRPGPHSQRRFGQSRRNFLDNRPTRSG